MGGILHAIMEDYGERDCKDKGVGKGGHGGALTPLPNWRNNKNKCVFLKHTMKVFLIAALKGIL